MKREAVLDYFFCDTKLTSTEDMNIFDRISAKSVYEVIKVVDGIPLFFEEHLERMKKSLVGLGTELKKSKEEILQEIVHLVEKNQCKFINVKLVYDESENEQSHFLTYFIKSEYPPSDYYEKGIHTILFQGKRETPNIKTVSGSFKEQVQKIREEEGAYEALLVDEEGYITEGSRSNIFFIKEDGFYTPPGGKVLLGVTRNYVIKLCKQLGIEVKEGLIGKDELKDIQGAFITGTTVDILPIGTIDSIQLLVTKNEKIKKISEAYNNEMEEDVRKTKAELEKKR